MSTIAIHCDSPFVMGPRPAFSWPGPLEPGSMSNGSMFGADFGIMGGSEPSLTPPSETRSLASSPPRGVWTPAQLEMRRQRDQVRRDLKLSARIQRVNGNSYAPSPSVTLGEVSSTMNVSNYTTAPSAVPLAATTMGGQSFLHSYSPTLQDQSQGGQAFASPYQQSLPPSYGVSMEYSPAYAGSGEYSARTPSLSMPQDAGVLYSMPTMATASNTGSAEGGSHVRVVQSRPKPRCWEHGCNGRQFSTFSNLLRHQREKSGQAAKAMCPNCGAEFTRTTARNGHLLHDKCKQRRSSNKDTVP